MRNLGLALVFMMMVAAPHAVHAKKKAGKHGKARQAKSMKHKKPVRHARAAPPKRLEADDDLATAVATRKSEPRTMTSAVAPSAVAPISNEPVSMGNQVLDDEVPGAKHKK